MTILNRFPCKYYCGRWFSNFASKKEHEMNWCPNRNEINFYLKDDEYGWLSNFWRCNQTVDGLIYPTNEHYYQSQKAAEVSEEMWIINAPLPYLAMCAGRSLREGKELREGWNVVIYKSFEEGGDVNIEKTLKVKVMLKGLRAKFKNPELRKKLLATGDVSIHEDSPTDIFWGKKGNDILGRLLMQVRDEIRNENI